jgi:serine/threonine protein kinase
VAGTTPPSDPPAPTRIGAYAVRGKVCDGTFGPIYEGLQEHLNRRVLLKVLEGGGAEDAGVKKRFLREARVAVQVRHHNLIGLHDVGTCPDSGRQFMALEYLEGGTLRDLLAREGPLTEERAYDLCVGIARALTCTEDQGMVHRDLSPENVFLTSGGEPKLGGLALVQQDGLEPVLESSQLATSDYTAPELWQGAVVDVRSDLYSLGVLLFELLTGRVPFDGPGAAAAADEVPDPGCSETAAILVRGLCAPDREARYANARDAMRDLQRALSARTPIGPQGQPSGDTSRDLKQQTYREDDSTRPFEVTVQREGRVFARQVLDLDRVVIGRSTSCDVTIDNPIVSRRHAEIVREGLTLTISPLSHTNSTAVNEEDIAGKVLLGPGDVVLLSGRIEVKVEFVSAPGEELPTHEFSVPTPRPPCGSYLISPGQRVSLNRSVQIGGLETCDIVLEVGSPRKAALVVPAKDGFLLFNVGPQPDAVVLNGEPVPDKALLSDGDEIYVCGQSLKFRDRPK